MEKQTELFGTDGIRGRVNADVITPDSLVNLALATAAWLKGQGLINQQRPMVLVAKDTRLSGYMLENAITSGFLSMGFDVKQLGPMPTPALARLTRAMRADLGVMITASHNPYVDNGVKLFTGEGFKLSDRQQQDIVERWQNLDFCLPNATELGRAQRLNDANGRYVEMLKADMPSRFLLPKMKVVVDCAHGAAYRVAPLLLHELGAQVIPINVSPDGTNINRDCGAMHIQEVLTATREHQADIGLAFDGDGDRLIVVDSQRRVYDGDAIVVMLAELWQDLAQARFRIPATQKLAGAVGTSQTNSGVERYFQKRQLCFHRTRYVGDRYVKQAMRDYQLPLGSEPSGHILMGDFAAVGDALAAATTLLAGIGLTHRSLDQLAAAYQPLPTQRRNVYFQRQQEVKAVVANDLITQAVEQAQRQVGPSGRVVLRAAGTEPVVRLFVETEKPELAAQIARQLEDAICALRC